MPSIEATATRLIPKLPAPRRTCYIKYKRFALSVGSILLDRVRGHIAAHRGLQYIVRHCHITGITWHVHEHMQTLGVMCKSHKPQINIRTSILFCTSGQTTGTICDRGTSADSTATYISAPNRWYANILPFTPQARNQGNYMAATPQMLGRGQPIFRRAVWACCLPVCLYV